jgi:HSP20 family protein
MAFTDLIPWGRHRSLTAPRFGDDSDPFLALSRDMNRILDDFTRGFGISPPTRFGAAGTWPHVEVRETDKDVAVVAELPGMDEKDLDVTAC